MKKVSLHQSGSWSHSFISTSQVALALPEGISRHLDKWQRPEPFAPGWRRAYTIIIPWTDLRQWADTERGDIIFAPDPGMGHWARIEILMASSAETRITFNEMFALARLRLSDGSEVAVIATRVKPSKEEALQLGYWREQALISAREALAQMGEVKGSHRLSLYGFQPDGTRMAIDLALLPPEPGDAVICTRTTPNQASERAYSIVDFPSTAS